MNFFGCFVLLPPLSFWSNTRWWCYGFRNPIISMVVRGIFLSEATSQFLVSLFNGSIKNNKKFQGHYSVWPWQGKFKCYYTNQRRNRIQMIHQHAYLYDHTQCWNVSKSFENLLKVECPKTRWLKDSLDAK